MTKVNHPSTEAVAVPVAGLYMDPGLAFTVGKTILPKLAKNPPALWCSVGTSGIVASNATGKKWKTRSIQRTQTPPRLWPLTLSCDLDLKSRSKKLMSWESLIVLYLGTTTRYDVCECNKLQDNTISSFLWPLTFICDLQRLSRSLSLWSLNVPYVVVYWYQVWSF